MRLRWTGRLQRITEESMPKRIFWDRPGRRRSKEDQGKSGWTVSRKASKTCAPNCEDKWQWPEGNGDLL